MLKTTQLSIALDNAPIASAHKHIDSLFKKLKEYNREVERSNKLLREQETLRRKLGVRVEKGKTIGLVKDK